MQHKKDFSSYFKLANLVIIVGYINKHTFQAYHKLIEVSVYKIEDIKI